MHIKALYIHCHSSFSTKEREMITVIFEWKSYFYSEKYEANEKLYQGFFAIKKTMETLQSGKSGWFLLLVDEYYWEISDRFFFHDRFNLWLTASYFYQAEYQPLQSAKEHVYQVSSRYFKIVLKLSLSTTDGWDWQTPIWFFRHVTLIISILKLIIKK